MDIREITTNLEDKIKYFNIFKSLVNKETPKPKSLEEIEQKVLTQQVDKMYYGLEVNYLFSEILFSLNFVKQYYPKIESEIIEEFHKEHVDKQYKRKFSIEKDTIVETDKGFLERKRKEVLDSGSFKKLVEFFEGQQSSQ